ncbi:MAG: cob(I)yrinic acid a,c-diamide adenosyltransferase [Candidatus Anstonellales archaeon]
MPIYTKGGDGGKTRLLSGELVQKFNPRIEAYGSVDELSSFIGVARSINKDKYLDALLKRIQSDLFIVCSELASTKEILSKEPNKRIKIEASHIHEIEKEIDKLEAELPRISSFLYPSGTTLAAIFHVSRSVCRRSERSVCNLMEKEPLNMNVQIYLNRLSDLLFLLARKSNKDRGEDEELWKI